MYNMMTCQGLGISVLGDCSLAWASFAIVLFLALILRRQCEDGFLAGTGYNIFGAFAVGLGANILLTTLTGSARWSLLAGVLGIAAGGFLIGMAFDTSGSGDSE